jgi:activating signal cointegrator 1
VKALSLWQPYASLLAAGKKRVESRSWSTSHCGPLLVHAAKRRDPTSINLTVMEPFYSALKAAFGPHWTWTDLPFGALVGRVDVVACYPTAKVFPGDDGTPFCDGESLAIDDTERAFGDYSAGRFAWLTANPVRFGTPVPYRGGLGLFDVPDELIPEATP